MLRKNIVILGAGFGGLKAASLLSKKIKKLGLEKDYRILLVDRNNYHTFSPLLYEVATTSQEIAENLELKSLVTYPIANLVKNKNIDFINDTVLHIDLGLGEVHLKTSKVKFDYLILALGSETNYFGIPGLREKSFGLKTFGEAIAIRDTIIKGVEEKNELVIVVGGGGSTGVELAAEIQRLISHLQKQTHKNTLAKIKVKLLQGAPAILSGFNPRLVRCARRRLRKLGIEVTYAVVSEIEEKRVIFENGRSLQFDILIWTGGIRAVSLTEKLPLKKEERGRVVLAGPLECLPQGTDLKVYGHIYAIGDIACIYDPKTNKPMPSVAQAAIIQASTAAKNIIEEVKKERGLTERLVVYKYEPKEYPYIIPVGGKYAVAQIGPLVISGLLAWVLKGLVELNYLISIMSFWSALKIWLKGLKVFIENDRLG